MFVLCGNVLTSCISSSSSWVNYVLKSSNCNSRSSAFYNPPEPRRDHIVSSSSSLSFYDSELCTLCKWKHVKVTLFRVSSSRHLWAENSLCFAGLQLAVISSITVFKWLACCEVFKFHSFSKCMSHLIHSPCMSFNTFGRCMSLKVLTEV